MKLKQFKDFLKDISKESFKDLLKRANIDIYAFNTSVLLSKDNHFRIASRMGFDGYGDCVQTFQLIHMQIYTFILIYNQPFKYKYNG